MALQQTLRSIETEVTKLIQSEIKKKGLVKTGKLLNSISTQVSMNSTGSISIKVSGEDYYDELDNKYRITEDAFNSSGFRIISDLIQTAVAEYIQDNLSKN